MQDYYLSFHREGNVIGQVQGSLERFGHTSLVLTSVLFFSFFFFKIFDVTSRIYRVRWALRDAKRTRLLLLSGRWALPHIRRKCFSILARTQLRAPRTNANFISLPPLLPAPMPRSCCLRKNQLYPAISIGLHAKMSTLYCYHRHIIRGIGTSHFPVGGRGIGGERAFALTAAAKPIKRQIRASDIRKSFYTSRILRSERRA